MIANLQVIARYRDGGDGGLNVNLYGDWDALLENTYEVKNGKLTKEKLKEYLLNEEDLYEYGSAKVLNIKVDVDEAGKVKLAGNDTYIHFGQ